MSVPRRPRALFGVLHLLALMCRNYLMGQLALQTLGPSATDLTTLGCGVRAGLTLPRVQVAREPIRSGVLPMAINEVVHKLH